jgi:hypothetical protein
MDRNELEEYVERANGIAEDAPQMGEANTKEMLVRPFLEVLGWEFHPSEVKLEYPVRMASRRTKVDYALMLNEAPAVFVEAKGLDTELSEDHREQVTSYMHNEESVEWGLLTNGEEYEFFMYDGSPSGFSLGKFELTELPKNTEVVGTLSKDSVSSGESEDRAKRLRERRRAVSTLREDKDGIADDVTETVTERVGDSVASVAETEAKEFVDRVVKELEGDRDGTRGKGNTGVDTADTESSRILFVEEGDTVASFGGDTQADAMADAVRNLIDKRNLLDEISIPYVPGEKQAVLNDKPENAEGEEMRGAREISGVYLKTHMSKRQKETRMEELTDKCGLGVRFNW